MGYITSVDTLIASMSDNSTPKADNLNWLKTGRAGGAINTSSIAGKIITAWLMEGFPGDAATPSTLTYPDNTTRGGFKQIDPTGGRQKWLTAFLAQYADLGTFVLYDRLAQQGGLAGNVSTNQSVSSTITRYTSGIGNWLMLEISVQGGSPTTTTFHFDYTDENGASATTYEHQIGASNYNNPQMCFLPALVPVAGVGGRGVKNMTNFKLAATNLGTGFDLCATIIHPLCFAAANLAGIAGMANWLQGALPVEILTDACLGLLFMPNASGSPGYMMGSAHFVEA